MRSPHQRHAVCWRCGSSDPHPEQTYRLWLTTSPRPAKTSGWPSAWKRPMSWDKVPKHHQPPPSMIMILMWSIRSRPSTPPSLTTSLWTWRLTRESGRQPQPLRASQHACGPTPNWQRRLRWQCTTPVSSAHCYTAVRRGPRIPGKKGVWTPSTWEASATSWKCRGKTRCPTLKSCLAQVCQARSHCSDSANAAG